MFSAESIGAYTVSQRRHHNGHELEAQVVVGLEVDGETLWQPEEPGIGQSLPRYERMEAEETDIPLSEPMRGLPDFFKTYILQRGRAPRSDLRTYDCHFFARSMQGDSRTYHNLRRLSVTERRANEALRTADLYEEATLGLGRLGILGFKAHADDGPVSARHSIIGLGEESEDCLQVLGAHGPLVIADIGATSEHYRYESTHPGHYGLYLPE